MRILILLLGFITVNIASAQTIATLKNGKKVMLYPDGTWEYATVNAKAGKTTTTIAPYYTKKSTSSSLIKGEKVNYGVYYNPTKWTIEKETSNEDAEYSFKLSGEDCYGMVIPERIQIPLETLKEIALENAQAAAPDTRVVKSQDVYVNKVKVHMMQMEGTLKGIPFVYLGYYYSGKQGSIQLVTYTATNLLSEYKSRMLELLNGFVVYDK